MKLAPVLVGFLLSMILVACSQSPPPAYTIEGDGIAAPLGGVAGDAERGRVVFSEREQGHCVICHQVAGLDVPFQGNVGPSLTGVGDRLTSAQLRLRIVDIGSVKPGTLMPSYFRTDDLHQVGKAYQGETILSARQIEDLVAYLGTLKAGDEE